ncbi:unnamed protein product, partial [Urochloa humidicola]
YAVGRRRGRGWSCAVGESSVRAVDGSKGSRGAPLPPVASTVIAARYCCSCTSAAASRAAVAASRALPRLAPSAKSCCWRRKMRIAMAAATELEEVSRERRSRGVRREVEDPRRVGSDRGRHRRGALAGRCCRSAFPTAGPHGSPPSPWCPPRPPPPAAPLPPRPHPLPRLPKRQEHPTPPNQSFPAAGCVKFGRLAAFPSTPGC